MYRWVLMGLGLTLAVTVVCPRSLRADAPATPAPKPADLAQAAALVQQLGDRSFEVRQKAHRELQGMGPGIQTILRDNLNNSDLEISSRCDRLLALATRSEAEIALDAFLQKQDETLLEKLPAWKRFNEMAGKEASAKMLFVEVYSSEGQLLEALEKDPKKVNEMLNARCTQLQQMLWLPGGGQGNVSTSQLVALLFAASDARLTFDLNLFYQMTNLLYQPNIQQSFKNDAGCRKILATFIEKRCDQNTLPNVMHLVLQMEIRELVPVALKMATAKETQGYYKATALMIVGKMGSKDDAVKLEPLLSDNTNLGSATFGTTTVTAQVRDVALAAMIEANGQSVTDYGFPYLQANQVQGPYIQPSWYGFTDQAGRDAALKKFKEWQTKHANK